MNTKPQGEPDDEQPGIQFDEEREEQRLEECEEAERDAVELLRRALHDHSGQPPPSDEPAKVAATVRPRLRAGNHPFAWMRQPEAAVELELVDGTIADEFEANMLTDRTSRRQQPPANPHHPVSVEPPVQLSRNEGCCDHRENPRIP